MPVLKGALRVAQGCICSVPLQRIAHAVLPEAIPNGLAQGHCWQHGCRCQRAEVDSRPAAVVGERFRGSRCYVSCSGCTGSRRWTSPGKSAGTAVIILSRHQLRNAPRGWFQEGLLHLCSERACALHRVIPWWADWTCCLCRWIATCALYLYSEYRSSVCQNSRGVFSRDWDFPPVRWTPGLLLVLTSLCPFKEQKIVGFLEIGRKLK